MLSHRRRWMVAVLLSLAAVLLLSFPGVVDAQTKTLRWYRWDSDIQINADGTFHVREVYEIAFIGGDFTFGFRNIPVVQFEALQRFAVSEGDTKYTEARTERPFTFYVTHSGEEYVITWYYPATRDQTRTFTIEYDVVGGIHVSADVGDRFFWKAVGPDHDFPIESSTVVVRMPPGAIIDTSLEPAFFGPDATYAISQDRTVVTYHADYIPAGQAFEVGVRFPHGFIPDAKPAWQEQYERDQQWNETGRPVWNLALGGFAILILIGMVGGVYLLWLIKGRDPASGVVPSHLSEPPSELSPGLVGTLVDEKADLQDIIATLVDLARRGVVEMEEREKKFFGLSVSRDFILRKNPDYKEALRKYEELLLDEVFRGATEVALGELQEKFYAAIPRLQRELYVEAVKEGLFPVSPKAVRGRYIGLGIAGLVIAVGLGFCAGAAVPRPVDALACPFMALGLGSLGMIIASGAMPVKTRKGAEEAAKWRSFRAYLRDAERYANLEEATEQFDRYLPFAIAFGLEKAWVNKFARIPATPIPRWYIPVGGQPWVGQPDSMGGGGVRGKASGGRDVRGEAVRPMPSLEGASDRLMSGLGSMSGGLIAMLNATATTFTSVPHSSGSGGGGGFSGGGFSGGGGGGGGGAGFG